MKVLLFLALCVLSSCAGSRLNMFGKKTLCSDFPGMSGCAGSDAWACQLKSTKEYECIHREDKRSPLHIIPVKRDEPMPREVWSKCISCGLDDMSMQQIKKPRGPRHFKGEAYGCDITPTKTVGFKCPLFGVEKEFNSVRVSLVDGPLVPTAKPFGCQDHSVICKDELMESTCDNKKPDDSLVEVVSKAFDFSPAGRAEYAKFWQRLETFTQKLRYDPKYDEYDGDDCKAAGLNFHKKASVAVQCEAEGGSFSPVQNPIFVYPSKACSLIASKSVSGDKIFDEEMKKPIQGLLRVTGIEHVSAASGSFQWTGAVPLQRFFASMKENNPLATEKCKGILGSNQNEWAHSYCVFRLIDSVLSARCKNDLAHREIYCKDKWNLMPRISPRQLAVLLKSEEKITEKEYQTIMSFKSSCKVHMTSLFARWENSRLSEFSATKVEDVCEMFGKDVDEHDAEGYFQPFRIGSEIYILIEGRKGYLFSEVHSAVRSCRGSALDCFNDVQRMLLSKPLVGSILAAPDN